MESLGLNPNDAVSRNVAARGLERDHSRVSQAGDDNKALLLCHFDPSTSQMFHFKLRSFMIIKYHGDPFL